MTLRGGGLFVVDAKATPMAIVGEYDKATVKGNGCGGVHVGDSMYVNSRGEGDCGLRTADYGLTDCICSPQPAACSL